MGAVKPVLFKDRHEWRRWLAENGAAAHEIWLVHYKKAFDQTSISLSEAVEEALCFGWIDGKLRRVDNEKFVLRYSPRNPRSVWSQINRDRVGRLTAAGQMSPAGLAAVAAAKKSGAWYSAYTNKTGDVIPVDLLEALEANPTALAYFNAFAKSYRNMYISWVTAAKTEATRQKLILEVVKRAALNNKPGVD